VLSETLDQVKKKLQRCSWDVMDEEQRDRLIKDVIVPRWGATTRDGHVLKATLWAEILGTTERTIRGRYERLKRRSEPISERPSTEPSQFQKDDIRGARSAIRNHPELAAELLKDPEIAATIRDAIVTQERREMHHERPIQIRSLDDQWHDWLNRANTLFLNGARLASHTDAEHVDLDAHAAAARMLYDRLVERQIDAEIRAFMDAEV